MLCLNDKVYFQLDNVSYHATDIVKEWFHDYDMKETSLCCFGLHNPQISILLSICKIKLEVSSDTKTDPLSFTLSEDGILQASSQILQTTCSTSGRAVLLSKLVDGS